MRSTELGGTATRALGNSLARRQRAVPALVRLSAGVNGDADTPGLAAGSVFALLRATITNSDNALLLFGVCPNTHDWLSAKRQPDLSAPAIVRLGV